MSRRRDPVLLVVRLDHQEDGPRQLHGVDAGNDGRSDVLVHGHMESGVDHTDRTVERHVVCVGHRGENVVRQTYVTAGHDQHSHRVLGTFRLCR